MTRVARCCCQRCEIEVEGEPALNALCHCDNCKRRTGSAFGWSAYFPDDKVSLRRGEVRRYEVTTVPAERFFCETCGTTLYWRTSGFMDGHTGIAGGCFTETPLPEPGVSARHPQRCAWVGLPQSWAAIP